MWRDACRELQFDANTSVGGRLKLLMPQVTADGLRTDTRLGLGMRVERSSLHLISSHTMSRTVHVSNLKMSAESHKAGWKVSEPDLVYS